MNTEILFAIVSSCLAGTGCPWATAQGLLRLGRQPIGALVQGMPSVTPEPRPAYVMGLGQAVQCPPQVLVLDRLPGAGSPATAHPIG